MTFLQQPSGSQLLACNSQAVPGREASGRLWLGGPQGMPVSQHPPKQQHLPTPLLNGTILSHPWEVTLGSSPELNNFPPPPRRQSASLVAMQLAGTKGDAVLFRGLGRGQGAVFLQVSWRSGVCVRPGRGSLRNCLIDSLMGPLVLCSRWQGQRRQAHCGLHTNLSRNPAPGATLHTNTLRKGGF